MYLTLRLWGCCRLGSLAIGAGSYFMWSFQDTARQRSDPRTCGLPLMTAILAMSPVSIFLVTVFSVHRSRARLLEGTGAGLSLLKIYHQAPFTNSGGAAQCGCSWDRPVAWSRRSCRGPNVVGTGVITIHPMIQEGALLAKLCSGVEGNGLTGGQNHAARIMGGPGPR